MPIKGRAFGQVRPPLTDILKNILLRYPDGGQILKELIQNADDAGATEVKFLYDATTYGTDSLASPELARFQGPALYCYNSAEFTEEDWDGLQRLMRSNKKDNPLKVGRFGIGFNSVYHITDLPSIVSGDTVAFLDPHEKYFVRGEPGQAFSMADPLLDGIYDQFEPFHGIFDCLLNQGNYYKGTLFRFPLRTHPSDLSTKVYTMQMVNSLFESFQKEASIILHFLKSIESISLHKRDNRGTISRIYSVNISEASKSYVRAKRNELTADITSDWDFSPKSVFYRLEVEEQYEGKAFTRRKWFMASQVGTRDSRLTELSKNLQLLPWIGIAFPVDMKEAAVHRGRIFCFLPLPPDADCRTGLPVQVNGYFGLSDNRRSLKWPGPDCQNDDTAEWNQLLLRKVGSRVYVSLVENVIRSVEITSIQTAELAAHVQLVYSAIPRVSEVKEDWRCFLEPFFTEIMMKDIFYTEADGKVGWINLREAILDRLDQSVGKDVKQVVVPALLRSGVPVITVPENILEMIDNHSQKSGSITIQEITPALVRNVVRKSDKWKGTSMGAEEKLHLLEYTLQDTPSNAMDLHGVPLLPLENGDFCVFQNFGKPYSPVVRKVFVASDQHKKALLPISMDRIVRDCLPTTLRQKLEQLTSFNHNGVSPTQLFKITADDVIQLLWENFPREWLADRHGELQVVSWTPGKQFHPPDTWLPSVWKWIREQYPYSLSRFEGMPLIPLSLSQGQQSQPDSWLTSVWNLFSRNMSSESPCNALGRLRRHSRIIFASYPNIRDSLPSSLLQLLVASGCSVVQRAPPLLNHQQILEYVPPPTPEGLLKVLMVVRENVVAQLPNISAEAKFQLRSFFSRLTKISTAESSFLLTLPIFRAVDQKHFLPCLVNNNKLPVAPPNFSLPAGVQILDQKNTVASSEEETFVLLKKLGMTVETTASLLRTGLQQYLECTHYDDQEKNKLILWILERMEILAEEESNFTAFLRQLAFVPTTSGRRRPPCQIYDHCDKLLAQLLLDNPDAFPAKDFLDAMKKRKSHLEVRCRDNLTAQDVLEITNVKSSSPHNQIKKGKALLYLLNERAQLLSNRGYGYLLSEKLSTLAWLPRVVHRPDNYPTFMPWYEGERVCKPSDMCPSSLALLVGASVPLFDERDVKKEIRDALCIPNNCKFPMVVKQLRLAIETWNEQRAELSGMQLVKFQDLVKNIYRECSNNTSHTVKQLLDEAQLSDWVWYGDGFTSPQKVALSSPFPSNIILHPHLFLLPKEFHDLQHFLLPFGVKREFTDEDLYSVLWSIKQRHDVMTVDAVDAVQDLDSCRIILERLVRGGRALSEDSRAKLLIPVQTSSSNLRLEPCNECTYCDREFLRRGGSEFDVTTDFHLIHASIPDSLASSLGVPRLSRCLADAEPLGYEIEEAGQHEPLTTRLRNILQEYKEGVGIFKELIQNADDAGASKVCFVMDWRNTAGVKLLSPELGKCQGPALWAYNNAMFSKKDFENINLLAGETKKEDLDKIGRFGLGFNAVYHLTDVPSFMSAEYFVMFDPNMNHIQDVVGKNSRTGMKINMMKSRRVLSLFPDQFKPYHDLFGCNTKTANPGAFPYKGTLFRFPLRTKEQAEQSKISKNHYNREDMCHMLESLKKSASTLLLFAQNVKHVRVFEIRNDSDPTSALGEPIINVSKDEKTILHSNDIDKYGKGTFLRNCFNWWKNRRVNVQQGTEQEFGPRRTELLRISLSIKESTLTNTEESFKEQDTWLVNSCSGRGASVNVAESDKGRNNWLLPISGAAVKMMHNKPYDQLHHDAKVFPVRGEVFCFLPLSFPSGLPVHVNGYFSVHSNRRGIWEEGVGEHEALKPFEAKWNAALMDDALAQAYLDLLEVIKSHANRQYLFHSLWPNPSLVSHPAAWKPFTDAFFRRIIDERRALFYCDREWRSLQDCFILDSKLRKVPECLTIMNILGISVISIPEHFLEGFRSSGRAATIDDKTLTEEKFLRRYFFPNVAKIPTEVRNSVIYHVLDRRLSKHGNYDDLFQRYPCFSCSANSKALRKPSDLVHPRGKVACLFSEDENRFPVDEQFLTKERTMMLEELGMVVNHLPWNGLCERAEWISNHGSDQHGRAVFLVKYLVQFLEIPGTGNPDSAQKARLCAASFLPILQEPKEYPIIWKGNTVPKNALFSANDLYPERFKSLLGTSKLILDESSKAFGTLRKLKSILGLTSREPKLTDVLVQLDRIIEHVNSATKAQESVKTICVAIYDHFQKIASNVNDESKQKYLLNELSRRQWMLVKEKMISPNLVAIKWDKQDGSPYLFTLTSTFVHKYRDLVKLCGVKQEFTCDDFLRAVWKLRDDTNGRSLSHQQLTVLLNFLQEICSSSDKNLENLPKPLFLPDTHAILHDSTQLAINDAPWIQYDDSIQYVHESIPVMIAYDCGAKPLRDAVVSHCSQPIGQPFGQHECLTDRLSGILKSYPADEGILKELVQNADDAKASEIHFVYDPRTHTNERIFSENWKELQGPSICVYNDQLFSDDDIQGIQNLGIGSKVDDPEKTGQYGIGFNAVYHLTDCPSFLSDDEILCVSDPHQRYIPGADEKYPGRLFNQLDDRFRNNFKDVLVGFLGEFFNLKGGTMFRFPLRRPGEFKSKISSEYFFHIDIRELLKKFQAAAKKMLLFLNNVKKISISEIKNGKLETFSVSCSVSDEHKRRDFSRKISQYKKTPTKEIPWHLIHYTMTISDSNKVKEKWLINQCLGFKNVDLNDLPVPDGTKLGVLPRSGIAASLPSEDSHLYSPLRKTHQAFCFLPLPVSTSLPVHVNGHFALDSARRDLWHAPEPNPDERTSWNDFIKRRVIAPTYASLICEARQYCKWDQKVSDRKMIFGSEVDTEVSLRWYHNLFPSVNQKADKWKAVGEALYTVLSHEAMPVLPVAQSVPKREPEFPSFLHHISTPVSVAWCSVAEVFFIEDETKDSSLEKSLLDVGLPLLSHTPSYIHSGFKIHGEVKVVSPAAVTDFLRTGSKLKNELPMIVKNTSLANYRNVKILLKYCSSTKAKADDFFPKLQGLPLSLTQDEVLRCFTVHAPVFCSQFSDLLPPKAELFLHNSIRVFFESHLEKCSDIVKEFDIADLSRFEDAVFPNGRNLAAMHHRWNPSAEKNLDPFVKWLKRLWEFVDHLSSAKNTFDILEDIKTWPIIPTMQDCLVPVSIAKTVLNASSLVNPDSNSDRKRRNQLQKLGCPQLNTTLMPVRHNFRSNATGYTVVLKHYLALIQSPVDVLGLLEYTFDTVTNPQENRLSDEETQELMTFLQEDCRSLSKDLLRKLPFYKTIDGHYTQLPSFRSYYEVPDELPLDDCGLLSDIADCVFLRQVPILRKLYQCVEIRKASSVEFYLSIVLKYFSHLSPAGRYCHLKYIRDSLLPRLPTKESERAQLVRCLKELPFIPDNSGTLRRAREFYDVRNEVFAAFVPKEKFPPTPFDSEDWKDFLLEVGLQAVVTEKQFEEYAKHVACEVSKPSASQHEMLSNMSKFLVSYLFKNHHLHHCQYLQRISKIKFVQAAEITRELLAIHPAYNTQSDRTSKSNYIQFNDSVTSSHAYLLWSSASLLSRSATPMGEFREHLTHWLNVHTKPPLPNIISHTKNISSRFNGGKEKQIPSALRFKISRVMEKLYDYFKTCCPRAKNSSIPDCSMECQTTCEALREVPVVLVGGNIFVRAKQLVFRSSYKTLEPHIFEVPRDLVQYEHFLKALGAQEYTTPCQYADVLQTIKNSCGEEKMHPEERRSALSAVHGLFYTLHRGNEASQERKIIEFDDTQSLSNVHVLYLPTEDGYLKPSTELLVNDSMERKSRLQEHWTNLLVDITIKDAESTDKLVELLPPHLKLKKLSSEIGDELNPDCVEKNCFLEKNQEGCPFTQRYKRLMCSTEFSNALIRLYKCQENVPQVPETVQKKLRAMEKCLTVCCMQTIETRLVYKMSQKPIPGSEKEVSCFCQRVPNGFKIFIKHGEGEKNRVVFLKQLASFVHQITGRHVNEAKWPFIMMILDVQEPADIAQSLDEARIPKAISSSYHEPALGKFIPEHFLYLLRSDIDYYFRDGELVGYEVEEEDVEHEAVYVYAKIIEQTHEGEGNFKFTSRYKIDIGQGEPVEVNKHKLYKFDREGTKVARNKEKAKTGSDIVPYEGATSDDTDTQTEENDTPLKPTTLEEAKKEVAEALKEIWSLPESERRSAIRRLLMRWHPDKNFGSEALANEVTKFLFNEVERLENGGTPGYREPGSERTDRTPKRHPSRQPRSNCHYDFSGFSESFREQTRRNQRRYDEWRERSQRSTRDNATEPPNRNEANKWLRQGREDLNEAISIIERRNPASYTFACFHCHQTAEKCLKALLFAKGRIERRDLEEHDIVKLAYRASREDESLRELPQLISGLHNYYIKTRYPEYNRYFPDHRIPSDIYTEYDADTALRKARRIHQLIADILDA